MQFEPTRLAADIARAADAIASAMPAATLATPEMQRALLALAGTAALLDRARHPMTLAGLLPPQRASASKKPLRLVADRRR